MNIEEIEKFLSKNLPLNNEFVQIKFKQRETFYGLFVKDADYAYLKAKNFWRIIPQSKLDAYKTSKDANLARIFNGAEFSKLVTYKESFE
ncbi:MAG TPA: short-chain dehydrogenase [Flavisolibacter sp.]|nr:short-chain dehydrogenase [Flavisolibacter sp.]